MKILQNILTSLLEKVGIKLSDVTDELDNKTLFFSIGVLLLVVAGFLWFKDKQDEPDEPDEPESIDEPVPANCDMCSNAGEPFGPYTRLEDGTVACKACADQLKA